ncbi:MAG: hypothetical protein MI919_36740 [Holophagales bacterium]|nr:hypothetical protein [Holophagales bacterium]
MSLGHHVGAHLGRGIHIIPLRDLLAEISEGSLSDAVVFLWQPRSDSSTRHVSTFREIVLGTPLVVFVAGPGSENSFDLLLEALATPNPMPQIMTRHYEGSLVECIEELTQATWPSECRFDGWKRYLLVSDAEELDAVHRASIRVLGEKRHS